MNRGRRIALAAGVAVAIPFVAIVFACMGLFVGTAGGIKAIVDLLRG